MFLLTGNASAWDYTFQALYFFQQNYKIAQL